MTAKQESLTLRYVTLSLNVINYLNLIYNEDFQYKVLFRTF